MWDTARRLNRRMEGKARCIRRGVEVRPAGVQGTWGIAGE